MKHSAVVTHGQSIATRARYSLGMPRSLVSVVVGALFAGCAAQLVRAQTNSQTSDYSDYEFSGGFGKWTRDISNNAVSVRLWYPLANDQGIALFSGFTTIREFSLKVPSRYNMGISAAGIASLTPLTNLTKLSVACAGSLRPGVVEAICRLKQLRELQLYAAHPPPQEYACLTNLQNLTTLSIIYNTNFCDRELSILTNLTNLRSLTLRDDGFSEEGVRVLAGMTSLTNKDVQVWRRSTKR